MMFPPFIRRQRNLTRRCQTSEYIRRLASSINRPMLLEQDMFNSR